MKNELQINKLQQHAEHETLQNLRGELYLKCGTYACEAHNNERSVEQAIKCVTGSIGHYRDYYATLARNATAIGQEELATTFIETSRLFTPWNIEELIKDRQTFDNLVLELELLLTSNSGDVIFEIFGEGEQADES